MQAAEKIVDSRTLAEPRSARTRMELTLSPVVPVLSIVTSLAQPSSLAQSYDNADAYQVCSLLLPLEESYGFAADALMIQENTVAQDDSVLSEKCLFTTTIGTVYYAAPSNPHPMPSTTRQNTIKSSSPGRVAAPTSPARLLDKYFYFFMSLLIPVIVTYGFSYTVDKNLIHPAVPRPTVLYFHAAIFSGWLVFFTLQSALVRTYNVQWHRRVGWFGVALSVAVTVLGISTAITMARFNAVQLRSTHEDSNLMIPLFDMACFTTTFALAILWRKKPEFHRRLILIATCSLTAAAFGRFPERLLPSQLFYGGVDSLIVLAVVRDRMVNRNVHRVYLYALPAFVIGQTLVTYTVFHGLPYWQKIAHAILS